ncbi:MAG: hypothetical protein JWN43_3744, partial [Gammaproteobacteria bacterium]|nr:hypothetical protein [Gammaproteobacteria bacterium]
SAMFAMVFSLAVPPQADGGIMSTWYFALGAISYLLYATIANSLLNSRYRTRIVAETLLSMASLVRAQAEQFVPRGAQPASGPIGRLLREQAAFADQLQAARDVLLESPRTPRRQQLAGMLVCILEMRDQLLACELDVDLLAIHRSQEPVLAALRESLYEHVGRIEALADSFLAGREPERFVSDRSRLEQLPWTAGPAPSILARGLAARVMEMGEEISRLYALARREVQPDLSIVRASWRMFISPTAWSWEPLATLWHWDAPPLRHAIRAALAIATAYAISLLVPWRAHAYWILLTIVVVLRGSLAQTLERRNSRVAGTLLGSVIAGALLWSRLPSPAIMLIVPLAQGVAHAFAVKRYLVTAIAATVLALLQTHLLNADMSVAFQAFERIADTLIGVGVAWAFSYVLPAWERTQIPALVARTLRAQAHHAHVSLELGQLSAVDDRPELQWRLARREVYDSLSALVQAIQRCLSEPRAVRPPLEPLERLVAHSYQLLAQLTAVKTLLLLHRGHLDGGQIAAPLESSMQRIDAILNAHRPSIAAIEQTVSSSEPLALPDPFGRDVTPWLLRRLRSATELAEQIRDEAERVRAPLGH